MTDFDKASELLGQFKGDSYIFGAGVLSNVGKVAAVGKTAALVRTVFPDSDNFIKIIEESLAESSVKLAAKLRVHGLIARGRTCCG